MNLKNRKESLTLTAIEIIDELGYQGLTTKELSKRQNISEAAIYKYFKNKNDLIVTVLNYYDEYFEKIYNSSEFEHLDALEAIDFYIAKSLFLYEEHPAMTAILNSYETFRHQEEIANSVSKIFANRINFLKKLIQNGIDTHVIDGGISAESMAYMMVGTLTSVTLMWRIQNYNFPLYDKIQQMTQEIKKKVIL